MVPLALTAAVVQEALRVEVAALAPT